MLPSTETAVVAILRADPSVSQDQVKAVLRALTGAGDAPKSDADADRVISRREAAAILHCTPRTVTSYARRGIIRPVRLGAGGLRASGFSARSVEAALAAKDAASC